MVLIFPHLDSVRIQSKCSKLRTRKTPDMDTFDAVYMTCLLLKKLKTAATESLYIYWPRCKTQKNYK